MKDAVLKVEKVASQSNLDSNNSNGKSSGNGKTRYSDAELQEFKLNILKRLEKAEYDYRMLSGSLRNEGNGVEDTSPTFKLLEEGVNVLSKEEVGKLAQHRFRFILSLKNALIRVENKTYGVCRETGKLIPKERLRAAPGATTTIEGKVPSIPKRR